MKKMMMSACFEIAMKGISSALTIISKILPGDSRSDNMAIQKKVAGNQTISSTHFYRSKT
ncbi:MAG: hypothetical protein ABI707_00375 [Ferruginibacter sp.]